VFRVTQEAITNIARHAGVNEANVTWVVTPDRLRISIADSGKGFETNARTTSTGLSGMAERVKMAGGRFNLQSAPGKGALILAEFDLKQGE
jgi:signal transduction histidine kinase